MEDRKFVERLGELYNSVMDMRTDDDYVVNQPQMEKFVDVVEFFMEMANKNDGELQPLKLSPKRENAGVTATFILFDVYGDDIAKFSDCIRKVSAFSINPTINEKVCISVTVPEVFRPKNEA